MKLKFYYLLFLQFHLHYKKLHQKQNTIKNILINRYHHFFLIVSINIEQILENTAEQDHVTVEIENAKELVGKDLNKHIKHLEDKMNTFASKLEFEDAARIRDEINRLKAKEVGLSDKILKFKKK